MTDPVKPRGESLWLFGDPEADPSGAPPPVRKARRGKTAPRQVVRQGRDLFTAVAGAFARSSEAAREPETARRKPRRDAPADGVEAYTRKPPRARKPTEPVPADSPPATPPVPEPVDDTPVPEDSLSPTAAEPVPADMPVETAAPAKRPRARKPRERAPEVPAEPGPSPLVRLAALADTEAPPPVSTEPVFADIPLDAPEFDLPLDLPSADLPVLADIPPARRAPTSTPTPTPAPAPAPARRQQVLDVLADAEHVAETALVQLPDRPLGGGQQLQHMRILASAGSGKTYQLTNRYLQILSRGAYPYSILASTFTRAAAGEIRDRILRTLAEAAAEDIKRDELGKRLQRELSRQRVLDLLASLANNLHRLQIRTLDSFFGTIVRCFSLELGLPTDARIVDEDEAFRLRREAIGLMLEEGDTDAVVELLASLTEGSSERAVTDTIDNTVSSLYDLYREAQNTSAWDAIPPEAVLDGPQLDDAIGALRAAVPTELGKRGVEAHAKDCTRAELTRTGSSDDWMEFFGTGLAKKVAESDLVYYGKPIAGATVDAYRRLLKHARAVYRRRVIDQTRATHTLLALFDSCYRRVKRDHKVLTFADLTVALAQADLAGHLDEICFRIDARLRHVLLDEMQDTSIQQWNALRPIVDETVSYTPEERSFFCVGDVKQSIYGWRNACPEILSRIDALLGAGAGIVKQTLATSYRSAPAVIEVVNKIFGGLAHNPALARYPDAAQRWDEEFTAHSTTRSELAGYVRLRTVARCEDQSRRTNLRLQEAAHLVAELYQRHPGKTIGVLLRTNGAVGRVLYELGPTRLKVPATGRGGGPLTDAPAVNAILDLLRLADHPDHSVAAFNVLSSPLGPVVGLTEDGPGPRHRVAARVRRAVASDGLAPTLQPWIKAIAGQVDERQYRRCMQLIQLAQTWDERASLRCDDFVALVESRAVADPAASAVQVMTIHQAKGLEFDIVILPELEGELASTRTLKVVYERDGDAGPISRIARHVSKDMWSMFDDLRPMFEQHIGRLAHESLCLLYVAVTRAREALFMLVDPPAENSRSAPARMASLVLHALRPADSAPAEPDQVVFEWGDPQWLAPHPPVAPAAVDPSDPHLEAPLAPLAFAPTQGPLLRSASTLASDLTGRTVGDVLVLSDGPTSAWAAALRALFAEVAWLEEFRGDRKALRAAVQAVVPNRDEAWAAARVDEFLQLLDAPDLRRALSRGGAPAGALRVERQVPFARLEGGALQTGEVPRVVLECADMSETTGPEVHVRRATVLGFCLDAVEGPAHAAERAAAYREPMSAWRAATAEQWGLERGDVAGVLLFVNAGVAVPLT